MLSKCKCVLTFSLLHSNLDKTSWILWMYNWPENQTAASNRTHDYEGNKLFAFTFSPTEFLTHVLEGPALASLIFKDCCAAAWIAYFLWCKRFEIRVNMRGGHSGQYTLRQSSFAHCDTWSPNKRQRQILMRQSLDCKAGGGGAVIPATTEENS